MKRRAGFTLVELMVASGLLAAGISIALLPMQKIQDTVFTAIKMNQSTADANTVRQLLSWYFDRATGVALTQNGVVRPGYAVHTEGALVIDADLRPCATFDPATSTLPANETRIRVMCCERNMNLNADVPGGGTENIQSACVDRNGLGIQEFRPATNRVIREMCFPTVDQLSVSLAGLNEVTNSPYYTVDYTMVSRRLSDNSADPLYSSSSILFLSTGVTGGLIAQCRAPSMPF